MLAPLIGRAVRSVLSAVDGRRLSLVPALAYIQGSLGKSGAFERMERVIQGLVWPGRVVLLALAYVVTAHLSYLVASPGTYASAVFPPAGIALAAVLIWGC